MLNNVFKRKIFRKIFGINNYLTIKNELIFISSRTLL